MRNLTHPTKVSGQQGDLETSSLAPIVFPLLAALLSILQLMLATTWQGWPWILLGGFKFIMFGAFFLTATNAVLIPQSPLKVI